MNEVIKVEGLKKSYGSHAVLKGLSFAVRQGEIFSLLGVNGAGKTTALECMEGLRAYDGGNITVHGRCGIQLQSAALPEHIRAAEALRLFSEWNKSGKETSWMEELGIQEFAKKRYGALSTGQKRRLHLALALTGNPDILFLDEPTAGLDVEGRLALHGLLRRLKAQGRTVILSSHDMSEVESLCDRIAILHEGKAAFLGTALELTERVGKCYHITVKTGEGTERIDSDDITETLLELLETYKKKGLAILDLKVDRGTLEQHFMKIAKGE